MSVKIRKAKDKANREVTVGATIFFSILFAVIGLACGIGQLALVRVIEVRKMPDEEAIQSKAVYYIRGKETATDSYRPKERALFESRSGIYRFNEEELNSWARNAFKFSRARADDGGILDVNPSLPNFRIEDSELQISMVIEFDLYNAERQKSRFQAIGTFEEEGDVWQFKPHTAYLGTAKLPGILIAPMVTSLCISMFENQEIYPKLQEAWLGLDVVKLEERELILQHR